MMKYLEMQSRIYENNQRPWSDEV